MKVVIFVETKEGIQFKCDTFWSKSPYASDAKIYSNSNSLKALLQSVLPHNIYDMKYIRDTYDDAKLGYFIPDISLYENDYRLKNYTKIDDLGKPVYLWVIKMNDISEWVIEKVYPITHNDDKELFVVDVGSIGLFIDYKQTHRDELIEDILNKKELD